MVLKLPGRLIDRDERTRKIRMRVLVLGMCRTGTTTLSSALRRLGYTPHQMREVLLHPKDLALWQEGLDLTYISPSQQASKKPYGKAEFDKLLGDYDVVMDIPGCVFANELIEAYPEAKVILTTRDYKSWEESMQQSIWCLCTWDLFNAARILHASQMAPLIRLVHSIFKVHNGNAYGGQQAKEAYEAHYTMVRDLVPKEQLLEMDPDHMTWEPLCDFLNRPVPKEPIPKAKEEKAMRQYLDRAWWGMVQYCVLMLVLPGIVMLLCIVFYNHVDALRELRDEYILLPIRAFLDDRS
ncbi:hypothetical protein ACEQ8H_005963 [Pleosporales sp. CAS-2024a]